MVICLILVEDIKLNSTVFHWPEHIHTVFELSNSRINTRREALEEDLRKRVSAFEDKLAEYMKEVDAFRKKEVKSHFANYKRQDSIKRK